MLDYQQLRTLLAVEETGTFEGAARSMGLSSFAVADRIKRLETNLKVTLVERSPTRTSEAGKILCDHARRVISMEEKVLANRQSSTCAGQTDELIATVAMDEYCMDHGIGDVLIPDTDMKVDVSCHIKIAHPTQTHRLMQSGEVQAAISTHKEPIHGFKAYRLTAIDYVAVANPAFVEECFADGLSAEALSKAPCYRQCKNDDLAMVWAQNHINERCKLSLFKYPFSDGALRICLAGNAWTMLPASIARPHLSDGSLVELKPNSIINRDLYWHVSWSFVRPLEAITKDIKFAAQKL